MACSLSALALAVRVMTFANPLPSLASSHNCGWSHMVPEALCSESRMRNRIRYQDADVPRPLAVDSEEPRADKYVVV